MTILVVGAGATGGYFGQRLAMAGRDVTLLVRPRRAQQLRERGLRVVGLGREERIEPKLVTAMDIEGTQPDHSYDVVLLTVKASALRQAMDDVAPIVGPRTRIVPFLNGMAHLDELTLRFGVRTVLGCVVMVMTQLDAAGDIVQLGPLQSLEIGALPDEAAGSGCTAAQDERLAEVAAELSDAGFDLAVSADILGAMWAKWVMIATLGALTCLMRAPVGDIAAAPGGERLAPAILAEAASIAEAAGHPVPRGHLDALAAQFSEPGSPLASSMYRDLSDGAPTEVEQILGDLVARARQADLSTPLLDLATLSLRAYELRRSRG